MQITKNTFPRIVELTDFADTSTAIPLDTALLKEVVLGMFIDPVVGDLNLGLERSESLSSVSLSGNYSGMFDTTIKYFEEKLITTADDPSPPAYVPNAETADGFKELKEVWYPELAAQGKVVQPSITNDVNKIPKEPRQTLFHYSVKSTADKTVRYNITVYYRDHVFDVVTGDPEEIYDDLPVTRAEHTQGSRPEISKSVFAASQTITYDESVPYNTIKSYYP